MHQEKRARRKRQLLVGQAKILDVGLSVQLAGRTIEFKCDLSIGTKTNAGPV